MFVLILFFRRLDGALLTFFDGDKFDYDFIVKLQSSDLDEFVVISSLFPA